MADIKYQIKGTAQTGPISATARSLEALSEQGGGVQNMMMGLQAASQGSVTAVFSLARSVKALWTAIAAGQMAVPLFAAIAAAAWAAGKAWEWWNKKQDEANEAVEAAGKKMDTLIQRMRELRKPVQVKLNLDRTKQDVESLVKLFDTLNTRADAASESGRQLRQSQTETKLAVIDKVAAADPNQSAANQIVYERQRQAVNDAAAAAEIDASRAELAGRRLRIEQEISNLQGRAAQTPAAIGIADRRVRTAKDNVAAARGDPVKHKEAVQQLEDARAEQARIRAEEEARQKNIVNLISQRSYELKQLQNEQKIIEATKSAVDARNAAERETLNLKERQAAAAEKEKKAAEDLAAKKKSKAEAEAAAAAKAESDEKRLGGLRSVEGAASAAAGQMRDRATDPQARAAARAADREAAREKSNWEKQVARAEKAKERGGTLTRHTRDVLKAAEMEKLAGQAGAAADQLENQMASSLTDIEQNTQKMLAKIEKVLTLS